MSHGKCKNSVHLHDGFSLKEKILLSFPWYIYVFTGAYAVFSESIGWGIGYFLFCSIGFYYGTLYTLCSRCPYPYEYSDCLFFPYKFITKFYKRRSGPMTGLDKIALLISMAGMVIFPQYWLFKQPALLILFWVFCIPAWAMLPLYLCKRCRNHVCPINMARLDIK